MKNVLKRSDYDFLLLIAWAHLALALLHIENSDDPVIVTNRDLFDSMQNIS